MNDLIHREWDVIVVGTGVGGATLGLALARQGKSVLFVEKGRRGFRTEQQSMNRAIEDPVARLIRGCWPSVQMYGKINGQDQFPFPFLGCGVGGSSVFYGGTLERPERHDFEHSKTFPHPTGGWPVKWDEMLPWFEAAEAIYRVRKEEEGLPSTMTSQTSERSDEDRAIMHRLQSNGFHPYRLHTAIADRKDCLGCLGTKCPRDCKMDARSAAIEPALATGHATLLDQCEVTAVRGVSHRVTHVEVTYRGIRLALRAKIFALAAGALSSPRLLLASRSQEWPSGFANQHDLVGRNLMFHLNEMFAIWPPTKNKTSIPSKSVGMRDLYALGAQRMGMIQAMGVNVPYSAVNHFLEERMRAGGLSIFRKAAPLIAWPVSKVLGQAKLFVGLLEDLPYLKNRVYLDPARSSQICFEYTMHPELMARRAQFRRAIRNAFKGMWPVFANWQPELNYGHPCGTLCAGSDPRSSVLNAHCRVHDVENLYVVDASFFPTSMGVNPSLTIAANALRVANHLARSHD